MRGKNAGKTQDDTTEVGEKRTMMGDMTMEELQRLDNEALAQSYV